MSTLTILRLSERTRVRLLRRAAENGRSVEAKARAVLGVTVGLPNESTPVAVYRGSSEAEGVDIESPGRIDPPQDAMLP